MWATEGICILDASGTIFNNMAQKLTLVAQVWNTLDKNQKVKTGLDIINKMLGG